jgi:hypothetical protein
MSFPKFLRLCATSAAFLFAFVTLAHADTLSSELSASLSSGPLSGTNFQVLFSYNNAGVSNTGVQYVDITSFNFTLLGTQYTLADINEGGQVILDNSVIQYVTAAFLAPVPQTSPVEAIAFGFAGPNSIGYLSLSDQFGGGSYSVTDSSTPACLILGASAILFFKRRTT